MFKELFRRGDPPGDHPDGRPAPGTLGPGRRVYAVGDPHGCLDRLAALHRLVAADLAERPAPEPLLLHLGDYIDRGPDSAGIVDLLCGGDPLPGVPTVNLLGNHEAMMLDALAGYDKAGYDKAGYDKAGGDEMAAVHWLSNGGFASLESWRVAGSVPPAQWAAAIPAPHLAFLRALPREHRLDGYVFVHAGLRPGVDLAAQTDEDRVWIREPFLSARAPLLPDRPDLAVVHGHTPVRDPVVTATRIGVDTGAVRGGPLTCAVLQDGRVRFLQS